MTSSARVRPSWQIDISILREILVLPLRLSNFKGKAHLEEFMRTELVGEASPWRAASGQEAVEIPTSSAYMIDDLKDVSDYTHNEEDYKLRQRFAEQVYFHPFVKDFLFATGPQAPCRHFVRKNEHEIKTLRVCAALGPEKLGSYELDLAVERCVLSIVRDPGLALLTLEVAAAQNSERSQIQAIQPQYKPRVRRIKSSLPDDHLTLADALSLHDVLRRLYPPYFLKYGWNEGLFPADVIINPEPEQRGDRQHIYRLKHPLLMGDHKAIAPWWSKILGPLATSEMFTQVVDERIPSMMFVATPQEHLVAEKDRIRLCFADGPGDGDPYDPAFMKNFGSRNTYARFSHWGTTYFASSYSFSTLLRMGAMARDVLQEHFRRHYYRMFFIVQMQKAGLLMFSNWMSDSVKHPRTYARTIKQVRDDFTRFTHRFWFSNVSNQEQARELFQLMQTQSGNDQLYAEVNAESETARRELALLASQNDAENSFILNVLATVFTMLALSLAFWTPLSQLPILRGIKLDLLCMLLAANSFVSLCVIAGLRHRQKKSGMGGMAKWLTRFVIVGLAVVTCAAIGIALIPGTDEERITYLLSLLPWN